MKFKVTVTGARELKVKLDRLERSIAKENLANATLAGALVVEGSAKEKVHVITGNLRRSIHSAIEESTDTKATALVGSNVEYAPYEEFGTRYRGPHPYLRPAFDENKAKVQDTIGKALKQLLEQGVR